MRLLKRIVVITLLFAVALFAAMNPSAVTLDLLAVELKPPLGVALIGAFLLGMLCGALLILLRRPAKARAQIAVATTQSGDASVR